MKKSKKWLLLGLIAIVIIFLSGCNPITAGPITSESTGFWSQYFVYPLSWLLTKTASIFGSNYGISIILVTILIRFAILPLTIKQTKSTKAMQALQPEIKKLQEKYSSKDQATQQKLQQEQMALYQKNGVNPLAGCLPIFIQMPILFAFYHAIMRTEAIKQHDFLWFSLGKPDHFLHNMLDPGYIPLLPILAAITTFLQTKVSMIGQEQTGMMAQQMKIMLYLMPIMIFFFALNLPAALALYWVVGNIFMIIQTYFIKSPDIKAAKEKKAGGNK